MPLLPDGTYASGQKWFALRGRPKNPTEAGSATGAQLLSRSSLVGREEFWAKYDGFGGAASAFEAEQGPDLHAAVVRLLPRKVHGFVRFGAKGPGWFAVLGFKGGFVICVRI